MHISTLAQEEKVIINKLCFGKFCFRYTQRPHQQFLTQSYWNETQLQAVYVHTTFQTAVNKMSDIDLRFVCQLSLMDCCKEWPSRLVFAWHVMRMIHVFVEFVLL